MTQRRHIRRRLRGVLFVVLLVGLLATGTAATGAESTTAAESSSDGRRTITGTIDGADFRIEMPERWNGTLLLYSHGYYPAGFPFLGIWTTNRPPDRSETEVWLLEHGYALAASQLSEEGFGYHVERGLREQIALLDWFEDNVGRPRHTVSTGQSMGAAIALLLAERHPRRFSGVATTCGGPDPQGTYNGGLDVTFTVKTLLELEGRNIELVRPTNPEGSLQNYLDAIDQALTTPQGMARLALAGAFNNVTGWYAAHQPRPTNLADRIRAQASWVRNAYGFGRGPTARADLERRAGGNPSFNIGIDYRRQFARSDQRELALRAYREAGLDLQADLERLNAAPRIAPDPAAVAYMYRFGVPLGRTPVPVVTLHTTGDGGAVPDEERWYAEQVHRFGDPSQLRQLYIERGAHCSISAAEEIVTLHALFGRIDTGRWPNTSPRQLNEAADALGAGYHQVFDFGIFQDAPMPPAFTRFTPSRPMRPSR